MIDRTWRLAAYATIAAWAVFMVMARRPAAITDDWQGWRQADTAAIARNFVDEEFDPLRPRIDWRGDGPGYVETELQLYPAIVAALATATGDVELPAQLVSLACVALACALLFGALARRFGEVPAYVALLAALSMQGTIVASTSIQPDPLAFLAFTIGWLAFLDDLARPSARALATWIAATAIAGLVKPTTLELGLAQVAVVALAHRPALRRPRLWLGWAAVLAIVGAFLLYARTLYVTYGNTFGVLSGGDSKLPALSALAAVEPWRELARFGVVWGVGLLAVPAALYLAVRRRFACEELALAGAALALSLLAFRYTASTFGTHYLLPHVVLGAWLVAHVAAELPRPRVVLALAAIAALALSARAVRFVRALPREPESIMGAQLAALAPPGTRVVVRARAEGYNQQWHTTNNFQDPRVFYLARAKGWVVPNDLAGATAIADYALRGARYYVHVAQRPIDADLAAWLTAHAHRVAAGDAGEIYDLGLANVK
ncbi:MAG: glycosyltransferase family 39 protein [Myxococcales bacterium]|nr:glycosyltransferase family 39 protein [Myxococcales bacterium]